MTINLIKKVNNYPDELKGIAQRFLSLESDYNAIVKKLNDEKTALVNQFKQVSAQGDKQNRDRYHSEEQKFNNGEFLPLILSSTLKEWQSEKIRYTVTKFTATGLSIL